MRRSQVRRRRGETGQAAVEAALVLPLTIFLILGTIQLFMALQARLLAQYAASRVARSASVNFGNCEGMTHTAVLALLPSFTTFLGDATPGGNAAEKLANAWDLRKNGKFSPGVTDGKDGVYDRGVVWLIPTYTPDAQARDEEWFDDLDAGAASVEVRMIYWYPLRIPFANWVISTITLAQLGISSFDGFNPLNPSQKANWDQKSFSVDPAILPSKVFTEMAARHSAEQYSLPINVTYAMRMMTPLRGSGTCAVPGEWP